MSVFPLLDVVSRLRTAGCVFAEDEAELLTAAAATPEDLDDLVARRCSGVPLEQVLGWAEFCGLRIAVAPEVFVPRRRTELLVRQAVAAVAAVRALRSHPPTTPGSSDPPDAFGAPGRAGIPVVVDPCCGSGAVGAALLMAMRQIDLYSVDIHPAAVACARRNLPDVGERVYQGDLFAPLPAGLRGQVDVVVANVPYVPTGAIGLLPPEARDYEPREALDGGPDGLDVLRRVSAQAPSWLVPGGVLLVETSHRQAPEAVKAVAACGFIARMQTSPELDATVVVGTLVADVQTRRTGAAT
jgi:release factor glutamine methyltransferase